MPGLLCLQGGREFTIDCVDMDRAVVERASAGVVAVIAGAARVGSDYDGASDRARRHYIGLGVDVVVVPDPREEADRAVEALADSIHLVVLPGGSPANLLGVLSGAVGQRLLAMHASGTAISGASAGAMVLCSRMVRPDRDGNVVEALGLVDGLALPHWSPGAARWNVPDSETLWGLPECGGVLIDGDEYVAVGHGAASIRRQGEWTPVPR